MTFRDVEALKWKLTDVVYHNIASDIQKKGKLLLIPIFGGDTIAQCESGKEKGIIVGIKR